MVRWVILVLLLTGCSQPAPDDPDGLSGDVIEVAPGIIVAVERAALRVLVLDVAGFPVPDARVQLTGTDFFGRVDGEGRIAFVNVTPGMLTLRTERDGFLVDERPVHLNASALSEVEVRMLPTGAGSYRPHVHDLWRGRVQHTLFSGAFDYTRSRSDSDVAYGPVDQAARIAIHPNRNQSTSFALVPVPEEVDDDANLVFPGTRRIDITVSWEEADATLSEVGVAVRPPGGDRVALAARPSGSTWSVNVGPDGLGPSDVGHQPFTFWEFFIYPGNEAGQPSSWEPGLVVGPFDVTIVAIKGDTLPVEPEHRDFWKGASKLVLADDLVTAEPSNPTGDRYRQRGHMFLPDRTLVPPGTQRLTINHTWSYHSGGSELAGTPMDMPYVLTWRTADQSPHHTPLDEYRRTEGTPCGARCVAYDVAVEDGWVDGYYQARSLWAFLPSVEGYEDEIDYRPDPRPKDHYLEIIAWRDAS